MLADRLDGDILSVIVSNKPKLAPLHQQILALLQQHPNGLNIEEIRAAVGAQQHLDKRVRELRQWYLVPYETVQGRRVYVFRGEKAKGAADDGGINAKLRAAILHRAHGRCQMCGKTVAEDGVRLQIDHKIPRTWGGATVEDNLWAICQLCNGGKRDYFSSFNDEEMRQILSKESVYERISETLRLHLGKPTPSWLLQFVANADDYQEDWQKRLRELRYPPIGYRILPSKQKNLNGKVESFYALAEWHPLPPDHKLLIKKHEADVKATRLKSNTLL